MTDPVEAYMDRKRQVEKAAARVSRLEGQRDQWLSQLAEFECETVGQAETLLSKLEKKAAKQAEEVASGIEAFDAKWKGKL